MKRKLLLLVILLLLQPMVSNASKSESQLSFVVKTSSQSLFQSSLTVESDDLISAIIHAQSLGKVLEVPQSNNYLLFEDEGMIRTYLMDDRGQFYDVQRKEKLKFAPETIKKFNTYFKLLHKKHFGKLVDWEEANQLFPRYAKFKVTDLETGLSFDVQRRAGQNHADVQPLTREDTKIMKEIYAGKWSWKRRAVLIHLEDKVYAASMHGMPHGRGALANGFPGHFCIHFKGSKTHATKNEDLSHQIMVNKAAGIVRPYIKQLPAENIVELFFIALNQNDVDLLQAIYSGDIEWQKTIINKIESCRIVNWEIPTINESLVYEVPIEFKVKEKGKREFNKRFSFKIIRESLTDGWKLVNVPFEQ